MSVTTPLLNRGDWLQFLVHGSRERLLPLPLTTTDYLGENGIETNSQSELAKLKMERDTSYNCSKNNLIGSSTKMARRFPPLARMIGQ